MSTFSGYLVNLIMKKIRYIFLFLLVIITCTFGLLLSSCSNTDKDSEKNIHNNNPKEEESVGLDIAVISDIHLFCNSDLEKVDEETYFNYSAGKQRMFELSEAILKDTVDQLIEKKPKALIVLGDMVDTGSLDSFDVLIREFNRLESNGIQVYVNGGITDYSRRGAELAFHYAENTMTVDDFPVKLANFGFNEAIARDDVTLSYVCDIPNSDYRLLTIDTCSLYDYLLGTVENSIATPPVPNTLVDFIENALIQAKNDGKKVIVSSFFPINEKLGDVFYKISKRYIITLDRHELLEELFTEYGVEYIFSGFMHMTNDFTYTSEENGNSSIDYHVGALCNFPNPICYVKEKDEKLDVNIEYLEKLSPEYLSDLVDDDVKAKVTTDLYAYGREFVYERTIYKMGNVFYLDGDNYGNLKRVLALANLYGTDEETNEKAMVLMDSINDVFVEFLDMKIYGTDTDSLEKCCLEYDIVLPKIPYEYVYDLFIDILCDVYENKLDIGSDDDVVTILRYIVYVGFKKIADLDIFGKLHDINENVMECDLVAVADHLFETDILDLKISDTGLAIVSGINIYLQSNYKKTIKFSSSEDLFKALAAMEKFFPIIFGTDYDKEEKTIFGVYYKDYVNLSRGIIHLKTMFNDIIVDIFIKELLY